MLAWLILIVCFLVGAAVPYACKYIDFRGPGLTIKRRVGSSIKKMKPVEGKPAPELRLRLQDNALKLPSSRSPHMERTFLADDYRWAVKEYNEELRYSIPSCAWPDKDDYWGWSVKKGEEVSHEQWEEAQQSLLDHKLAAEMERLFNKITADDPMSTQIKIQIQLLWDDTFLPMIKLAHQTGESGRESYENQVKMLAKVIKELERRYELGMQAKQSLYTNYLTDLVNDLTPAPARSELTLDETRSALMDKSNGLLINVKRLREEMHRREMMSEH